MKPNDKAIEAAAKSLFGDYNDAEKKWVEEALTAAYAAQFKSEDYAGLVKELRKDISDPNGKMMSDWDSWRKYIASGGDSSWPRDQFEGHLDAIAEIHHSVADAIEALLAERDDFAEQLALRSESGMAKDMQEIMRINNELVAERDALKAEIDTISSAIKSHRYMDPPDGGSVTIAEQVARMWEENEALLARLAPVDDKELVEIAVQAGYKAEYEADMSAWLAETIFVEDIYKPLSIYKPLMRAVIAAIRPHIEAAAMERCAKIAEGKYEKLEPASQKSKDYKNGRLAAAAAIRSGK